MAKLFARAPGGAMLSIALGEPSVRELLARHPELDVAVVNVPDVTVVSGPELKSKWVGESEENLRQVFTRARQAAPAIIVFDELDSFATARGTYQGSGVEHSMVNQLLTEMDGFSGREGVIVLAATNQPDVLDRALLRPGRFDRRVIVNLPDKTGRTAILKVHTRNVPLADDVNLGELARRQFRDIARVAGLVFTGYPGGGKGTRQLQVSASLVYDVFQRYDPDNLLLHQARREVFEQQFELTRLERALYLMSHTERSLTEVALEVDLTSEPDVPRCACTGSGFVAQGHLEEAPSEGYEDWKAGGRAGVDFAVSVAALPTARVTIVRIAGLTTDTNPTVVGAAAAFALWQAVGFSPPAEVIGRLEATVFASWQLPHDHVPQFE